MKRLIGIFGVISLVSSSAFAEDGPAFTVAAKEYVDAAVAQRSLALEAFRNRADGFATAAQGALADTAVQPSELADVAFSGSYTDLTDKPNFDTSGKADKVADSVAGNLAGLDADGNITNSGLPAISVANKANKQGVGSDGVVAIVDAGGQYIRSGVALTDLATNSSVDTAIADASINYATAAQGALADTALQASDIAGKANVADLGTAAYAEATDFDTAGSAAAVQTNLTEFQNRDAGFATAAQGALADKAVLTNTLGTFEVTGIINIPTPILPTAS
ncbi:MAG: hypothetical protein FWF34_02820 [Alphaproteobacteria bacterium]|nr:hypothetical protein [Alphaproteobacteria bacterium]MCL2890163.1 hypothetical protein [Alphaproteobacteria bacterium]